MKNKFYLPLIPVALLALILGMWAGLQRMGWSLPAMNLALAHGPLMVSGFLGTLVMLERAVALRRGWMFVPPALTGLGWMLSLALPGQPLGALLFTLGSLGGIAILVVIVRRETHIYTVTMLVGMVVWFAGNLLWLSGKPIFQIVFAWQAFLILTVVGERLELNRVLRPTPRALLLFKIAAGIFLGGVILSVVDLGWGARVSGAGMLLLTVWSLRYDIAIRNLRHRLPLTRYIAWCLFLGFVWMGVAGGINLFYGRLVAGPLYDAAIHAVFVGFVISMIFGHAPIIFPALLQTQIVFSRWFYIHLALLHASLAVRLVGNLANDVLLRKWGGMINSVAIVVFLGMTVYSLLRGSKGQKRG